MTVDADPGSTEGEETSVGEGEANTEAEDKEVDEAGREVD